MFSCDLFPMCFYLTALRSFVVVYGMVSFGMGAMLCNYCSIIKMDLILRLVSRCAHFIEEWVGGNLTGD